MDVEAVLARARAAANETFVAKNNEDAAYIGEQLAEAFQALDEWLVKGGFLPAEWRR